MKRIYISGPMTGYDDFNYPAFFSAEERLVKRGYTVVNPARNQPCNTWHDYMRIDIKQMMDCDTLFMLKNWRTSKGACLEHYIAKELKFEIIYEGENL